MRTERIFALALFVTVAVFFVAGGTAQAAPEKATPGKVAPGRERSRLKLDSSAVCLLLLD